MAESNNATASDNNGWLVLAGNAMQRGCGPGAEGMTGLDSR